MITQIESMGLRGVSGRSGWWQLFLLAPVGGLVLVGILWAQPPSGALPEDGTAA